MKLSPYIVVNHVQEAIDFYKSTFGGEVVPLNEHQGKLLHAELKIQEDVVLHLSDDYGKGTSNTGAQILLTFNNKETQQRIYDALSEKGDPPVSYTHLTLPTMPVRCRSRWSPYH